MLICVATLASKAKVYVSWEVTHGYRAGKCFQFCSVTAARLRERLAFNELVEKSLG